MCGPPKQGQLAALVTGMRMANGLPPTPHAISAITGGRVQTGQSAGGTGGASDRKRAMFTGSGLKGGGSGNTLMTGSTMLSRATLLGG